MPQASLHDRAVVRITGPDSGAVLHNVLTLDLPDVDRHGSGYGALLTPQGKILWDFVLHRLPDGYAADLRADQAEAFAKRLALYKLRAKVEIAAAPDLAVFVEWPESPEHPADPRLALLGSRWLAPAGSVATAAAADWHRHRIALVIPEGGVDFVFGDTFPHDAAMDSLHGIAFDKGCYIGQEVVSRMRHRGTARRRIVALHAAGILPEPGAEITAGDRPLGRLGSSADGRGIGLVRLDRLRAALDAGVPILAGGEEVGVELPTWATYSWPADAAAGED
ncbi:MAG: folate-binding protein YgfZ [Rhizobiales bacterium]|nr:folate-binding protein YgfZ [Hyphomicrobiales bacterium]